MLRLQCSIILVHLCGVYPKRAPLCQSVSTGRSLCCSKICLTDATYRLPRHNRHLRVSVELDERERKREQQAQCYDGTLKKACDLRLANGEEPDTNISL